MKVIFLDIDGVMRPGRSYFKKRRLSLDWWITMSIKHLLRRLFGIEWHPQGTFWTHLHDRMGWRKSIHPIGDFDPLAIDIINRLHKQTGAVVVTNSVWNLDGTHHLRRLFRLEGLVAPIIGSTGYPRDVRKGSYTRLEAIELWLKEANKPVTHWCALDDAPIDSPNAIRVNYENGISMANYRKATEILGNHDPMFVCL